MASTVTCCQKPAVDYFQLTAQQPQKPTVSSSPEWDSSPYTDPAVFSDDSILTSPSTPNSVVFPDYTFPKQESDPVIKTEDPFDFGSVEDWIRWDKPSDNTYSSTSGFFPELKTEPLSPSMNRQDYQGNSLNSSSGIDPSRITEEPVFIEDPISDEPLFQTPSGMASSPRSLNDLPPREGLYSTPLSWSRPSLGQMQTFNQILSPQQESQLRSIAMPAGLSSDVYPTSPTSMSSPESNDSKRRKRKPSIEEDEEEEEEAPQPSTRNPPKKTAHNMIEKRYRTNLNDKIAALRDSVPSLRVMSKKNSKGEEIQEDLQGLTPAHKLNKATVLSKATEYIAHLEKRNKYLARENSALKARVDAFEILMMARQPQPQQQVPQQRNHTWMG